MSDEQQRLSAEIAAELWRRAAGLQMEANLPRPVTRRLGAYPAEVHRV